MKQLKKLFMLGIVTTAPLVFAQGTSPSFTEEEEIPQNQEGRELDNRPSEFPEDEFYVPEEANPQEQEERRLYPDDQEWELGDPLPEDEQNFNPTDEYDSF